MSTPVKIGLGPTPHPRRLQVGDLTLTFLDGGELWLDGGAMFGIIPKPMWAKGATVDEANRIPLAMTCTLVETGGKKILVETGCGAASKYSDKEQGFFRFGNYTIVDSLAAIGIEPEAIDIVILTHLHFDHAGGGTIAANGGGATASSHSNALGATGSSSASASVSYADKRVTYKPTFPRATYIIQRGEWDDAISGHVVMSGTYRPENLGPLDAAGVLSFVNGEAEIASGIAVRPMPGHTRHQQGVVFTSGNQSAILPADMIPTAAHLGLRHNMAYDLLPYENMVNKEKLLRNVAHIGATLLLGQDPNCPAWRVEEIEKRFIATKVALVNE